MKTRLLIIALFVSISALAVLSALCYHIIFGKTISLEGEDVELFISEGESYDDVFATITDLFKIKYPNILNWVAKQKKYPEQIKSGRYVFTEDMSYVDIINRLRSGQQDPINITFNNIRTIADLAKKVGEYLESDSAAIATYLSQPTNYTKYGFNEETILALFLPNTYQFYWNTSPQEFLERMVVEYNRFWNEDRREKAKAINLSPIEVSILASIVDGETNRNDEKARIAGVYLNRLRRGMLLQADPTVKYAVGDFSLRRILYKHLEIDSPYNTYKYAGLPPGPISSPTLESIDAVLNAEKHDYIFFVAKGDTSGYHNFSKTLTEHNRYVAQYRQAIR